MTETVDNIKLDKENAEFSNAVEFVHHTDKLVYLTGRAGTGKTTFLKYINKTTDKNTVVLAPTGVAAINAGGVTIHSFFQIPFGPFIPNDPRLRTNAVGSENKETIFTTFKYNEDKQKIIENLELLIIDEISMVRVDMLDVIDKILRVFRKIDSPFGEVQVILIGDVFQLPPVLDNEQEKILSQFYKTPFFFSSKVIEETTPLYIELKKIYRQNEQEFIDLLNRVRVNQVSQNDFKVLNAKYDPTFSGNGKDYIILATHKKIVSETNLTKLNQLETELFTFEANISGDFPESKKPTDDILKLKVDAQIMFVKNDIGKIKRYYNGKIGKIKELQKSSIIVVFDDKSEVTVERTEWDNIKYTYDKTQKKIVVERIGTFEQFPIRLAWAITVHKSQGLTFEKVIADLGGAFAPGQVYVALSRCTSFSGLVLKTELNKHAIKTDLRVIEFAKKETPDTLITEQLSTGKADFLYKKAREEFGNGKIKPAFEFFKRALKFRNDIETDIFQKFIEVNGKRLLNFKQKNSLLLKKFESADNELSQAKEIIESQAQELTEKSLKITEFSKDLLKAERELKKEKNKSLKKRARKTNTTNGYEYQNYPTLIEITGGTFTMGEESYGKQPTHEVTLSSYYIGKTEVTVAQYRFYCKATGTSMPNAPSWGWNDNDPIVRVNWNDAINYCDWLADKLDKDITLPTEAQWEFAARGGIQSKGYKYSGSNTLSTVGWYSGNKARKAHEVAQKKANELGLYDMSGNVWEWCLDWYDKNYYSNSPNKNPENTKGGEYKVLRGGCWDFDASNCRVAYRYIDSPDNGYYDFNYGFRVVSVLSTTVDESIDDVEVHWSDDKDFTLIPLSQEDVDDDVSNPPANTSKITKAEFEKIAAALSTVYKILESRRGEKPTFKELIEIVIERLGKTKIETAYNVYKQGWIDNKYAKTDFNAVYDDIFLGLNTLANNIDNLIFEKKETAEEKTVEEEPKEEQIVNEHNIPQTNFEKQYLKEEKELAIKNKKIIAQRKLEIENEKLRNAIDNAINKEDEEADESGFIGEDRQILALLIVDENEEDLSITPASIDNITEEEFSNINKKFKNLYEGLKVTLDKKPTFKELIEYLIKENGKVNTKTTFNLLKQSWTNNKYPKTNFTNVYDNIFIDTRALANDLMNSMIQENKTFDEVKEENNEILKGVRKESSATVDIDENGIPIKETEKEDEAIEKVKKVKKEKDTDKTEVGEEETALEEAINNLNNQADEVLHKEVKHWSDMTDEEFTL